MTRKFGIEEVRSFIEKDGLFTLVSTSYESCMKKLDIRCNTCNKVFPKCFNKFKSAGQGCVHCSKEQNTLNKYLDEKSVFKNLQKVHGHSLIFLSPYEGDHKKIKVKSKICKHTWSATPHNLKKGNYCPTCRESKLEIKVRRILDVLCEKLPHWSYEREVRFPDCRDRYTLPFDFCVFNSKKNKYYLIECQGIQHFKETLFSRDMEDRKRKDAIKREYAESKGIELITVHYNDQNIKDTVFKSLRISARRVSNGASGSSLIVGKSPSGEPAAKPRKGKCSTTIESARHDAGRQEARK